MKTTVEEAVNKFIQGFGSVCGWLTGLWVVAYFYPDLRHLIEALAAALARYAQS